MAKKKRKRVKKKRQVVIQQSNKVVTRTDNLLEKPDEKLEEKLEEKLDEELDEKSDEKSEKKLEKKTEEISEVELENDKKSDELALSKEIEIDLSNEIEYLDDFDEEEGKAVVDISEIREIEDNLENPAEEEKTEDYLDAEEDKADEYLDEEDDKIVDYLDEEEDKVEDYLDEEEDKEDYLDEEEDKVEDYLDAEEEKAEDYLDEIDEADYYLDEDDEALEESEKIEASENIEEKDIIEALENEEDVDSEIISDKNVEADLDDITDMNVEASLDVISDKNIDDDSDIENIVLSTKEQNMQGAKLRKHHTLLRIVAIVCVFLSTIIFAMGAGAGLALWNKNMSVSEFIDTVNGGAVVVKASPGLKEFSVDTEFNSQSKLKEFSIDDNLETEELAAEGKETEKLTAEGKETEKLAEKAEEENEVKSGNQEASEANESLENDATSETGTTSEADASVDKNASMDSNKSSESNVSTETDSSAELAADSNSSGKFVLTDEIANIQTLSSAGKESEVIYQATAEEVANVDELLVNPDDNGEISSNGGIPQNVVYEDPNINYPLPFTEVADSYFNDALFIGDSRMQGFGMHSGLNATFYTAVGFQLYNYNNAKIVKTANGKQTILDAIPYDAFTKIYIKVGLNEMGWGTEEKFEEVYAEFISKLREREPRAIIYIHGLLPVTAWKSAEDSAHNNPNIFARNEALKLFALRERAYYIDVNSVVSEPDGSLISASASDGIHMMGSYMTIWKEYLRTHAVAR